MISTILHHIAGDISGYIIVSFPENDACALARHLRTSPAKQTNDACLEILSEVGNVISGSCFASLNRFLGLTFDRSVPDATTDMTGALINSILADMGQSTNDALVAQLRFTIDALHICGTVFLLLDPDSTQSILQAAHRKLHSL